MADPKETIRLVLPSSGNDSLKVYVNQVNHANLFANTISANNFNVGTQTLEDFITSVSGGGGGGGGVSNGYITATFVSNNYLEDIKSTFGTGDVTNTYLTATFTSNNYVQDRLDTKATNTYVNSTFTSNGYVDGRFTSNSFVKAVFTSNNYVDNQLSTRIGIRATNAYVQSSFTSNSFALATFSSNSFMRDHVATEVAAIVNSAPAALDTLNELAAALGDDSNFATTVSNQIGIRSTNTYVNSTFTSNSYINDQLTARVGIRSTNTYVNSTFTSNNYVDGRFTSNNFVKAVFVSNNYFTDSSSGPTGGGSDQVFHENDQTVTTNYEITTNKNAMSAGPITINAGVTVTIPSGSEWSIV